MKTKTYEGNIATAREELAELQSVDWQALYTAASEKVAAANESYRTAAARLEGSGVPATTRSPINGLLIVAAPLRALRAARDRAFEERRQAEEGLRRVESLRRLVETGRNCPEFECREAPKLTPNEAAERGGRKLRWNPNTRLWEWVSERSPVPVGEKPWRTEIKKRRAAGNQRDAERQAARDRIRRQKSGEDNE